LAGDFLFLGKTDLMKFIFVSAFIFFLLPGFSQQPGFPASWAGNWKGELQWFRTGAKEPQKVNMELRIQPAANPGEYTWHIIYGKETEDSRPYILKQKDTAGIHWVIDENNGIVLDQFWTANKFCGAFTVMNSTIVNNYWLENDKLMVEFFTMGAKPLVITGKGTEESPSVDTYNIAGYQKAVLMRQ
jgi:hypothetical protein